MQRDSTLFQMAGTILVHQCCIPLHRRPRSASLQNSPPHGLMQAQPTPAAFMPSSTQPNRRPLCPLHPHSAGEIIHRSGRESTTSTTTATRPVRATPNSGPRWKSAAGPSGNSSHHTHDQTAHAPAGRPVHAAPVLVMGKPPADTAQHTASHTQTARKSRSLNRHAHAAGHQKQGTA